MGLYDQITTLLNTWRIKKRKREENDDPLQANKKPKNDDVEPYFLTPDVKKSESGTIDRNQFIHGEELSSTESRHVEFKEGGFIFKTEVLGQMIMKYACAFLNSEGGVLLAGVNDNGIVKGLYVSDKDWHSIVNQVHSIIDQFRPRVSRCLYTIRFIPVVKKSQFPSRIFSANELYVVKFSFCKGVEGDLYETGDHQVYLRRDGGVQGPLRPLDIKNLVISKYNATLKLRKVKKDNEADLKKKKLIT